MGQFDVLTVIESYYDAAPRSAAHAEVIGPFTLFANTGPGWQYYARPTLGMTAFSTDEVLQVCRRQHELGVPQAFEWVRETTPGVEAAVVAAGLLVREHPLLFLDSVEQLETTLPPGTSMRSVMPHDNLALIGAVATVGFASAGTAVGPESEEELQTAATQRRAEDLEFERERLRNGLTVIAAAFVDELPVGVGSHNPVGGVTEIVGVATLPAFRRRGIAGALTSYLSQNALNRRIETVFLSADEPAVARVYSRLGFRQIGKACVAEVPAPN